MLGSELLRFFQTLNTADVPSDVRKIANLVWENLDEIVPLGTAQGQRVKRIVALAQSAWDTLSPEVQTLLSRTPKVFPPLADLERCLLDHLEDLPDERSLI